VRGELSYAARVVVDAHFDPPPRASRVRRFLYGAALPFGLVAATLRTKEIRSRYLRVTGVQIAVLVAVAIVFFINSHRLAKAIQDEDGGAAATTLAIIATIVSTLSVIEWIIIALSRQHHELLAAMCAATTGATWAPLTAPPKIALDFAWLKKKLSRRIRGLLLFVSGIPPIALVYFAPRLGDKLYAVLTTAWGFYWISVFALANTEAAWTRVDARGPWFLRAAIALGKVPVIGWPARLYVRIWWRVSRSVHPACTAFELAPYEAAGLAVARSICGLPGVYLFMRPVFGVAAAHAMQAAHGSSIPPPPPSLQPGAPFSPPPLPPSR
jgi:hypothetical protein